MSMCDRLKGVANFDDAMFLLERRQPGATGSQALPALQIFKIPKTPATQPKGKGACAGSRYPLSSGIVNFPGRAVVPVNGIKSGVRLSARIEPMSESAAKHGNSDLQSE